MFSRGKHEKILRKGVTPEMTTTTADYQRLVAHHLAALGRDDIGLGKVREEGDALRIEFVKGTIREEGSIPLRVLNDPEGTRAALSRPSSP